ncbi:FAS1-like dehydratase domain-containing protein [Euzebya rosea]|uniref:FAS1-like dehydratase domain-containing protein n=1 Tax=Euzebya rosea TaxID=2052804 RepID=UPI000D3E0E49|nr:MaoC family dehydratase N-terminal domain-containing protein [Euzebya rosea]
MVRDVGYAFPPGSFTVTAARAEEFVLALGIGPEEGWAAEAGAPVPPGFLMYVTTYGAHPVHDAMEIDFMKAMYGGADIEEYAPIRVGDVLDVRPVVSSVVTKDGRNGPLTFVELTTDYITEDGTLAMRERSTTIQKG